MHGGGTWSGLFLREKVRYFSFRGGGGNWGFKYGQKSMQFRSWILSSRNGKRPRFAEQVLDIMPVPCWFKYPEQVLSNVSLPPPWWFEYPEQGLNNVSLPPPWWFEYPEQVLSNVSLPPLWWFESLMFLENRIATARGCLHFYSPNSKVFYFMFCTGIARIFMGAATRH